MCRQERGYVRHKRGEVRKERSEVRRFQFNLHSRWVKSEFLQRGFVLDTASPVPSAASTPPCARLAQSCALCDKILDFCIQIFDACRSWMRKHRDNLRQKRKLRVPNARPCAAKSNPVCTCD